MSDSYLTSQLGILTEPWVETIPPNALPGGGPRNMFAVCCKAFTREDRRPTIFYFHATTSRWMPMLSPKKGPIAAVDTASEAEELRKDAMGLVNTTRPIAPRAAA